MGEDRGAGGGRTGARDSSRVNSPEAVIPVAGREESESIIPSLGNHQLLFFFLFFFFNCVSINSAACCPPSMGAERLLIYMVFLTSHEVVEN